MTTTTTAKNSDDPHLAALVKAGDGQQQAVSTLR